MDCVRASSSTLNEHVTREQLEGGETLNSILMRISDALCFAIKLIDDSDNENAKNIIFLASEDLRACATCAINHENRGVKF